MLRSVAPLLVCFVLAITGCQSAATPWRPPLGRLHSAFCLLPSNREARMIDLVF
jgi:hypothetical protein